jgi:hypothetical protein
MTATEQIRNELERQALPRDRDAVPGVIEAIGNDEILLASGRAEVNMGGGNKNMSFFLVTDRGIHSSQKVSAGLFKSKIVAAFQSRDAIREVKLQIPLPDMCLVSCYDGKDKFVCGLSFEDEARARAALSGIKRWFAASGLPDR